MPNKGNEHWELTHLTEAEVEKESRYAWLALGCAVVVLAVCCGTGVALGGLFW